MKKFEGILLISDIDGTLVRNDKSLSEENLKAIEYFKDNGGSFSVITGRIPYGAKDVIEKVRPNVPCGCLNGGGVYDFSLRKYLFTEKLSKKVLEMVKYIDSNIPGIGIEVHTHDKIYFCKENTATDKHIADEKLPLLRCNYYDISEDFAKILFACEKDEDMLQLIRLLNSHKMAAEFDFVRSDEKYYEIISKNMSKGNMLKKITELIGKEIKRVIAIGDNDNDVSMIEQADIGIAVSNASETAKNAADFITVSNEEDAVAKIIYNIEKWL